MSKAVDKIKSHTRKTSIKMLKSEEQFAGFDINDKLLSSIEKKKNGIFNIYVKEKDESVRVSAPIVNNNHVNKRSQSKSRMSSPETNSKHNRNVNKRARKENNVQSEAIESTELNLQPSLELTTPTFNLTSPSPRSRRSSSRKPNVDITDDIFKIPFEQGWKRELVYRNTGDSTSVNRTNRSGDVYYYSPNNRKLRSLREIQEQLDLLITLEDNPLTIECFTFLKQPIGLNDRSKELIRDANSKISKEDSFVGSAVRPKKVKTPVPPSLDYDMSDNENNKSSSKMKIVFKNTKRSRSKSKKADNSDAVNTTSSTPEYINEDWQAIQSSATSKVSPSKTDDIETNTAINKRRNSEMNGSLVEHHNSMAIMQSMSYMVKAMGYVFKHLKVHELLTASRVNYAWNLIAMNKSLWQTVRLKNSTVYDWEKCMEAIHKYGTVTLDTRRMLIPTKIEDYEKFWFLFVVALKKAPRLKCIELYRCPINVVEDAIFSLTDLTVLNATSIKNPKVIKEGKNPNDFMSLNLHYSGQLIHLTELRLKGLSGIKLTQLPSFEHLIHLKCLALTSIKAFPKDFCRSLETVTQNLVFFEIGDCECLSKDFAVVLKRFTNLTSLRLETCCGLRFESFASDLFVSIRGLEKLRILELINIEFSNNVEVGLEACTGIKALLIIPAYVCQSATTNCHLIDCLKKLSNTLSHLVWGLTHELLRVTDLFITQYQQNQHSNIGYSLELSNAREATNNIPILRTRKPRQQPEESDTENDKDKDKSDNVDILSVPALEKLLETMMIHAKSKVIKVPFSTTTRVYLIEHFNDI